MNFSVYEKLLWRTRALLFSKGGAAHSRGPLVVAGLFRAASGIGKAARATCLALEEAGIEFTAIDLSERFGQCDLGPTGPEAPFPRSPTGTLILHVNAPETEPALLALRHFRRPGWRRIGVWVWETSEAPASWGRPSQLLSEIWTPSEFSKSAIEPIAQCPVKTVPHYVPAQKAGALLKPAAREAEATRFVVLTFADGKSSFHRKNPHGAVRAFRRAFPDQQNVRMIVKLRNVPMGSAFNIDLAQACAGDERIEIINESLSEHELSALMEKCDVFVSLHRAEGFGLPIAEAMARGKAVIATGWSGNMDYMNADNAVLADYSLIPVRDPYARYGADTKGVWADPDEQAASTALRKLMADKDARKQLGIRARAAIIRHCAGGRTVAALNSAAES